MELLAHLVQTGRIADIAIAVMLAEALLLVAYKLRAGAGIPFGLLANLSAGLCLLLALRTALTDGPPLLLAGFLSLSLLAHAADLLLRPRE